MYLDGALTSSDQMNTKLQHYAASLLRKDFDLIDCPKSLSEVSPELLSHVAREAWLDDLRDVHAAQFLAGIPAQSFTCIINESNIPTCVEGKNYLIVSASLILDVRT